MHMKYHPNPCLDHQFYKRKASFRNLLLNEPYTLNISFA